MIIGIIVAIVVVIVGYLLFFGRNNIFILTPSSPSPQASVLPSTSQLPSTSPQSSPSAQTSITTVSIKNFAFNPASISVTKGTTVKWMNNDSTAHQIVSDPDGSVFKSEVLNPGQSYTYTFDETGTFNYHCGIHPFMKGAVTSQ